jgi:GTPase
LGARVAIIGRPNVGKSTLFNRLVGRKLALVDDEPGVTRDRREGDARLADLAFTIVDTAGLEEGDSATLAGRMRAQTEAALADCDAILFVYDARAGLTAADRHFAAAVRRAGKPIIVVANKAEGLAGRDGVYEAFSLGLGDPIALSAEHGEGLGELYDALAAVLPPGARVDEDHEAEAEPLILGEEEDGSELDLARPLRIAVLGRPNAGKSTLVNRILGEERLLTGPEPGITRDSIGLDAEWAGRKLKIFDTAGLRRRSRVQGKIEKLAVADALRAVRFAEVVVLLLDATIPFEKQDLTLADLVEEEGRALVIGLNKWDLIDNKSDKARELRAEADRLLPQLRGTRVIPLSGLTGAHVEKLMEAVLATDAIWNMRISTGRLNRWLKPVVDATPPPAAAGRQVKIRYITQPKARPPFFVLFGNSVAAIPESYKRYLVNGLRETFGLFGVPIRLSLRSGSENPLRAEEAEWRKPDRAQKTCQSIVWTPSAPVRAECRLHGGHCSIPQGPRRARQWLCPRLPARPRVRPGRLDFSLRCPSHPIHVSPLR